ncbi:MFS transporter [Frigidibacter sp. MR17.24]|uniref:MFS transporter n=1 Tax=Frigidibacter sp. MR17.24 TaxID=3127345 RepID=UPI003012BB76
MQPRCALADPSPPRRWPVVSALGIVEILAWGSSYYLMAPLAAAIVAGTGWPLAQVVGALSLGLAVAGLASPAVGRLIARHGGRPVLTGGILCIAAGQLVLALAPSVAVFALGWVVIGLGMAAGLYDPCFAALGRIWGREARGAITQLTLWGGFASTVCWPLSALMLEAIGWRGAVAAYAGLQLAVSLPLIRRVLPREARRDPAPGPAAAAPRLTTRERRRFALMAAVFTLVALLMTIVSVHLVVLLAARGFGAAEAVALGALIGPAQVAARLVEMAGRGRHHPRWTLAAAGVAAGAGLVALGTGWVLPGVALVLYGGGNGLVSIARGALPLAWFGAGRYPALMGQLARPALLAQAAAPMLGALLLQAGGAAAVFGLLAAGGLLLAAMVAVLVALGDP